MMNNEQTYSWLEILFRYLGRLFINGECVNADSTHTHTQTSVGTLDCDV